PYAIPTRGAAHGPIGAVPQVPQAGSRGFGAGRGNAGGPIGGHLSHQQGSQQPIGNLGLNFNFPLSVGAPLSQSGLMTQMPPVQGLSQTFRDGFFTGGMSQASQSGYGVDYATQGAQTGE
ncbi:Regulator of nonsense transcripts 1-like protein, partial [Thalictrum thalictroides]